MHGELRFFRNLSQNILQKCLIEIAHHYGSNLHQKFVYPVFFFFGHELGSKIGRIPKLQGPFKMLDSEIHEPVDVLEKSYFSGTNFKTSYLSLKIIGKIVSRDT